MELNSEQNMNFEWKKDFKMYTDGQTNALFEEVADLTRNQRKL